MKRSGVADLPLHGGRVPQWLAERMTKLGTAITEAIVYDYGTSAFLSRLSDPFWFQAFGAVMGMDWHSSGITTSVMGALKRGLGARADELGIYICGGRGRFSRNTPHELRTIADRRGFDADALVRTSRLTARVDNNAIADGFQIYLHSFVVTSSGEWAVVQQGLNDRSGMARRYHWHSATVNDFVVAPHTGIVGENVGTIMNLVDNEAKPAQNALINIVREHPEKTLKMLSASLSESRHLRMPAHHEVRAENVDLKRLGSVLALAYERNLHDFAELLLLEKLGPRTLQSLALVAEVVHGAPSRFSDPARFSFAHGGKDRHPFPVPLKTYDESLEFLRKAVDKAKLRGNSGARVGLGRRDKIDGLRRLERFARTIESQLEPHADFDKVIAHENTISSSLRGRSVFDDKPRRRPRRPGEESDYAHNSRQLSLFQILAPDQ
ncbi:MAG: DUF763 domain-containing protein [Pyrinomonadaceae bacterium]